jgi:hypothetical protein
MRKWIDREAINLGFVTPEAPKMAYKDDPSKVDWNPAFDHIWALTESGVLARWKRSESAKELALAEGL